MAVDWSKFPPASPVTTALRARCPRCGEGRLFAGYLTVVERCAVCDLDLGQHDSGDGPAVFLIFILGALVVPLALWIEVLFGPPLWLHAIIWSAVILGITLGLLRPAKAYVIALQYRHRREDLEREREWMASDRGEEGGDGRDDRPS